MAPIILVFGATGRTGRHFVSLTLEQGYRVRALARDPSKLAMQHPRLELFQGSITDELALGNLLHGVHSVAAMLGDAQLQAKSKVNTHFVSKLIPEMRKQGVKAFLYQAGGLTRPYDGRLPASSRLIRNTLARFKGLIGQHEDNEAVIKYLVEEAQDIAWVVHRASLYSDGPTKGTLARSQTRLSVARFVDCAAYNLRLLADETAIRTCDLSFYVKVS